MVNTFDYIIVGAGSAGCVLADKLSASGASVLLLEAGGTDRRFWIKLPMGYGKTFYDAAVNWKFESEPQAGMAGRRIYFPRGKVLGGSSSINAMVYCRGLSSDFDDWAAMGNSGWSWDEVRPWYERFENPVDELGRAAEETQAGSQKKLFVSDVRREMHPIERHFFAGAAQAGLPFTEDFNGAQPEGVGRYRINSRRGRRWSAADAFLRPALRSGKVDLRCHALATQIVFEGRRASGLRYLVDGVQREAQARAAVLLCAGSVGSPALLQRSGVGPGALLQDLGIATVLDQANVGANLQDHLTMSYYYRASEPTLNNQLSSLWGQFKLGLQYVLTRGGPLSISVNQCGGFVRSHALAPRPDMQLYCNPLTYTLRDEGKGSRIQPDAFAGFILCFQPCRPLSRGRIDIAGADPQAAPRIRPNYLSDPEDAAQALRGAQLIRRLEQTAALQKLIQSPIAPSLAQMDNEAMLQDFRQRASTCYHPVGTCRMGPTAETSVVNPQLKVHGLDHLYVIDASVFPAVTSGNTHAPTTMLAHKGAAGLLAATRMNA